MQSISMKRSETVFVFLVIPTHNVFSCARGGKKITEKAVMTVLNSVDLR